MTGIYPTTSDRGSFLLNGEPHSFDPSPPVAEWTWSEKMQCLDSLRPDRSVFGLIQGRQVVDFFRTAGKNFTASDSKRFLAELVETGLATERRKGVVSLAPFPERWGEATDRGGVTLRVTRGLTWKNTFEVEVVGGRREMVPSSLADYVPPEKLIDENGFLLFAGKKMTRSIFRQIPVSSSPMLVYWPNAKSLALISYPFRGVFFVNYGRTRACEWWALVFEARRVVRIPFDAPDYPRFLEIREDPFTISYAEDHDGRKWWIDYTWDDGEETRLGWTATESSAEKWLSDRTQQAKAALRTLLIGERQAFLSA